MASVELKTNDFNPRRIVFNRLYYWFPPEANKRITIRYEKGKTYFVRLKCAEDAIDCGAAAYAG